MEMMRNIVLGVRKWTALQQLIFPTASAARNWKSCGRSLGEIPIDNADAILEEFLGFPEGTDRIEIWHWFDENYPEGVAVLMNGGKHGN